MVPTAPSLPRLEELLREWSGRRLLLLVPSRPVGHQMLERLARQGLSWANVRVRTAADVALEEATPLLARRGLERAGPIQTLFLVDELVRSGQAGAWFRRDPGPDGKGPGSREAPTDGLIRSIHRSLLELRRHGIEPGAIDAGAFSPPAKGEALAELLAAYEARLAALSLVDGPGILRLALERLRSEAGGEGPAVERPRVLIPAGLRFRGLEEELVEAVAGGRTLRFDPGAGGPRSIRFFHATSPADEVRSVLRRVAARGLPLDQVELVATDWATYAPILHALSARLELPVTFSNGLSIQETAPGRGALAYLDWIVSGYRADRLAAALAAADLVPSGGPAGDEGAGEVPGTRPTRLAGRLLAHGLLETGIGWGRERYRSWLERRSGRATPDRTRAGPGRGEVESALARFLDELLRLTPDGEAGVAEGAAALRGVVTRFTAERSALDRGGRVALLRTLDGLERIARAGGGAPVAVGGPVPVEARAEAAATGEGLPGREPLERVAGRLRGWVAGLAVGRGEPRPGALHLATLEQGGYGGRPYLFVLGLDEGRFPGRGVEDPLLLDSDRARLPGGLPRSGERTGARRRSLEELVERLDGSLTCSFASRDPTDGQEAAPSPALLDLFRKATGRADADYTALREALGAPDGPVPRGEERDQPPLDLSEGWLAALRVGPPGGDRLAWPGDALAGAYPLLAAGREAEEARASDRLTPHEGLVDPGDELDPRRTGEPVSAGQLETLAGCPLRYFFRHVLKLEPPDRPRFDPDRWLDPLERGHLLHRLYQLFLEERIHSGRAGAPVGEGDRARMEEIARAEIERQRERVPPPSEGVFERECREILDEALFFVDLEADRDDGGVPWLLERAFGMGDDPPVELELAADPARPQRLRLRGRIDRIDRLPDGTYVVWDYKTGSARRYESEHTYLEGGRQLQRVLYACAAEAILRREGLDPEPRVSRSGYLMVSRRARGQRVDRPQDPGRRAEARDLLRVLLDAAASGTFAPAPDAESLCAVCEYRPACDGPEAVRRVRARAEAGEPRLAFWEEVRRYE